MNLRHLSREKKPSLAYIYTPPGAEGKSQPAVMFLGGYRSDMNGTKAAFLEKRCQARGQGFLRFDYSGHGASGGLFADGTIGDWKQDALDIFDHVVNGPVILVGSSMGGWIGLLTALARAQHVRGFIGIAAAPDFTEDLYSRLSEKQKQTLTEKGEIFIPNDYSDEPYHYTLSFYEEAQAHLLLNTRHNVGFPLHMIQGGQDLDVLPETAEKIGHAFDSPDFQIISIEDGDHRLSRPIDLEIIDEQIRQMSI